MNSPRYSSPANHNSKAQIRKAFAIHRGRDPETVGSMDEDFLGGRGGAGSRAMRTADKMNPHALRSADAELSAGCRDGYTITPRFLQARMKTSRRPFTASETIAAFGLAAAFLAVLVPWGEAVSQIYPARPIRFLVGSPPGSGNDLVSRLLAQKLSERLGQPVVVEHKPG